MVSWAHRDLGTTAEGAASCASASVGQSATRAPVAAKKPVDSLRATTEGVAVRGSVADPPPLPRTIETARLRLRPWVETDAAGLFSLASDPQVGPAAGWPPHADVGTSARAIERELGGPGVYAMESLDGGRLIGCAALLGTDAANLPLAPDELELGFWVGRAHWGRGYATEGAGALVRAGFEAFDLAGVWALCTADNLGSRRVLAKLGFSDVLALGRAARPHLGDEAEMLAAFLPCEQRSGSERQAFVRTGLNDQKPKMTFASPSSS